MTIKDKFNRIDLSALPKEYQAELKQIKDDTENFSDQDLVDVYQDNFDMLWSNIERKYPEAIKAKKKLKISKPRSLDRGQGQWPDKDKPKKKLVIKKPRSSDRGDEKDPDCDEAVEELGKIRKKKEAAAQKRADAPKRQHQTLAAERQLVAFKHAIRTSDLKGDADRAQDFAKDLAKVYRKYGMEAIADKILEAAKPKG